MLKSTAALCSIGFSASQAVDSLYFRAHLSFVCFTLNSIQTTTFKSDSSDELFLNLLSFSVCWCAMGLKIVPLLCVPMNRTQQHEALERTAIVIHFSFVAQEWFVPQSDPKIRILPSFLKVLELSA